jgi:hypothetical protein
LRQSSAIESNVVLPLRVVFWIKKSPLSIFFFSYIKIGFQAPFRISLKNRGCLKKLISTF